MELLITRTGQGFVRDLNMGMFCCEECHSLENTSLGLWWHRDSKRVIEETGGKALCSACIPAVWASGNPSRFKGKWHGIFTRRLVVAGDDIINRRSLPELSEAEDARRKGFAYNVQSDMAFVSIDCRDCPEGDDHDDLLLTWWESDEEGVGEWYYVCREHAPEGIEVYNFDKGVI